ncbi:MAG TPA: A24 family peptidase [Candidatus Brocadiia bacterium]|nr:A24 family peptidase [Candidatus Brocadiia bacterium]
MVEGLELTRHGALLAMLICCAYTDLAKGKIYNAVTLPGLFLGLGLSFALDGAAPERRLFLESLYSVAIGGGAMFILYLFGGFGAGDVKLMAAVGALSASRSFTICSLMYAALIGAAVAIGLLIWKGRLLEGLKRSARLLFTLRRGARKAEAADDLFLPYGFAISAGALWAWLTLIAGVRL